MIKKFSFRLDRVLRHRENLEDLRERALAEVEARLVRERAAEAALLALRDDVLGDLARLQAGAFAADDRAPYTAFLAELARQLDEQRRRIAQTEALREDKRAELVRASQDRRIVEKLKEGRRAEYLQDVGRLEQALLDEAAGMAFVRADRVVRTVGEELE